MASKITLMYLIRTLTVISAVIFYNLSNSHAQEKPPAPSSDIPEIQRNNVTVMCIDCDIPFGTGVHKEVLDGLVENQYAAQLRKALYMQDILHQFESKAHFDNCDFNSSMAYIDSLLNQTEKQVNTAKAHEKNGNTADAGSAIKKAFFNLGQALHGVQDFYAHSNYVELSVAAVTRVTDIEIIKPWDSGDQDKITELAKSKLISGHVFWGLPQKCTDATISHSKLSKDSKDTISGKKRIKHLRNVSQFTIAVSLAREASLRFMEYAFRRWPILKKYNGKHVALEIIIDRRGQ